MWQKKKLLTNYNEAYDFALNKLSYRDYSKQDLERKLKERSCPEEIITAVTQKLEEYSLLDEKRYAEKVYHAWLAKKYYGINHLRLELRKKCVREDYFSYIESLLTENEQVERALNAVRICQKKNPQKYDQSNKEGAMNLARALMTRGFSNSVIRLTLNRLNFAGIE